MSHVEKFRESRLNVVEKLRRIKKVTKGLHCCLAPSHDKFVKYFSILMSHNDYEFSILL